MTTRFTGKVAVVTGAGGGIGRATALRFGDEGASVVCLDVDTESATATAAAIGPQAAGLSCDVTSPSSVADAMRQAVTAFGRIDVLANVAGIGGSVRFEELTLDRWHRTLAVNLTGTFSTISAALPELERSRGVVVNVASVAGLTGIAFAADYAASKGGVVALSRALAIELVDRGVRVRCICPAGVDTAMVAGFRLPEGATVPATARRPSRSERPLLPPADVAAAIADASAQTTTRDDPVLVLPPRTAT